MHDGLYYLDKDISPVVGQEQVQGDHQDTSNEAIRWPRFNEEQNLQVYSRRHQHHQEKPVLQAQEETSVGLTQSDLHGSSPPNDGSKAISRMEGSYDGGDGSA